jgi:hypothetical protein
MLNTHAEACAVKCCFLYDSCYTSDSFASYGLCLHRSGAVYAGGIIPGTQIRASSQYTVAQVRCECVSCQASYQPTIGTVVFTVVALCFESALPCKHGHWVLCEQGTMYVIDDVLVPPTQTSSMMLNASAAISSNPVRDGAFLIVLLSQLHYWQGDWYLHSTAKDHKYNKLLSEDFHRF